MGYAIDANGEVSSTLSVIDIDKISGTSTPTSEVTMSANLPAEADVGTVQTTTIEVYDSLGVAHNVEMSFTKTAANTWDVSFANPTSTDDATTATGTAATTTFTLTFNDDGTLASATPALELDITGWTSGAADSVITFDIGETGEASGLTQYASTDGSGTLELGSQAQNGARFGNLSGVEVTEGGTVVAKFDNGQTREIYRIPLAVFSNADGLDPAGENVFSASAASGDYILRMPGTGGAGDIQGAALETSTTDINSEFTKLIECQAAYSAASKLITVSNDMMDTLINVIR
jgi:flagellar hook protein FlgE